MDRRWSKIGGNLSAAGVSDHPPASSLHIVVVVDIIFIIIIIITIIIINIIIITEIFLGSFSGRGNLFCEGYFCICFANCTDTQEMYVFHARVTK